MFKIKNKSLVARADGAAVFPLSSLWQRTEETEQPQRENISLDERIELEMMRARRYARPLTVVAIDVNCDNSKIHSFYRELVSRVRALDVVIIPPPASSRQRCLLLCPETSTDGWPGLEGRLMANWEACEVSCGLANFPTDGEWFDVLAEVATNRIDT